VSASDTLQSLGEDTVRTIGSQRLGLAQLRKSYGEQSRAGQQTNWMHHRLKGNTIVFLSRCRTINYSGMDRGSWSPNYGA